MTEFDPRQTPWQLDESEFYEIESREEQLRFLIRYAILAPSGHNAQPWRFAIDDDGIQIYADFDRRVPVADPNDRELLLSVGACIANLRIAAAHFGFKTTVAYTTGADDTQPVAVVVLRETCNPDKSLARLFPAITARRTNRRPFEERTIDETALGQLCDFIDERSDTLRFIVPHDRRQTAELIAKADRILMSRDAFRDELAEWMRPNESQADDGMAGDAFGIPGPVSALGPWMVRRFDLGPAQATHDKELAENAAGLIVVTAEDDRVSLLRGGEMLEQLLLLLTQLRISYSFLNQPIEVDELRSELWSMVRSPRPPQLLLRIGYARVPARPMPRRPVEKVLC